MQPKFYHPLTATVSCVILDIEYGINDKVIASWMIDGKLERVTKNTIHYGGNYAGGDYFIKYGQRMYLNSFIRV